MLNKAFEFVRIADTNPGDEKVRRRKEAASSLLKLLGENRDLMLSILQGVVAGFDAAPLTQDSPVVGAIISAVKEHDAAFPNDLSENAMELRSVAAIAIGELLTQSDSSPSLRGNAVLAALSLQSALALRATGTEKHLRAMLEILADAAQKTTKTESYKRRQRSSASLAALEDFVVSEEGEEEESGSLVEALPLIKSAFKETRENAATDREELETLWWLFGGYSETQRMPLQKLSPAAAAFCSGLELAERSLLPPSSSTIAMVDRAVQTNRKTALKAMTLEAAFQDWTKPMMEALLTPGAPVKGRPDLYPALLPIAWACMQARDEAQSPTTLDKGFKAATGIDGKQEASPADWGAQIFREKIVLRALARKEK